MTIASEGHESFSFFPRISLMRLWAAILAAFMSVTTVGTLRCPCQFAALFERTISRERTSQVHAEVPAEHRCPCHAHQDSEPPCPAEEDPHQPVPSCPHGPGLDLATPTTVGERTGTDGEPPVASLAESVPASLASLPSLVATRFHRIYDSSQSHRLRYSHSYRC